MPGLIIYRSFWFFSGIVLFMLAACFYISNPIAALAAGPASSVTITLPILPGPLTETLHDVSFVSQTTNGAYTTNTYQLNIALIDATGSGSGWNLALAASLPSSTTAILTQVNIACAPSSTCSLPQNNIAYPVIMQGSDATTASILSAGTNSGMGAFAITATLSINTPTSANISSFDNPLTLLISSGTM